MNKEIKIFYPLSRSETMKVTLRTEDGVCFYMMPEKITGSADITVWVNGILVFSEAAKTPPAY